MESTRRLSLTLLLVTPLLARSVSSEDLGLPGVTAWGGPTEQTELQTEWNDSTEPAAYDEPEAYDEGYENFGAWLRRKRDLDSPEAEEDMETAEQVLFRPTFRYKHLVKAREQRQKLREELRRQFTQKSPAPASSAPTVASLRPSSPTAQRKYYNAYQQQGVYTPRAPTPQRVYPPQVSPAPTAQRVYSQQVTPAQRVYSPQIPSTKRVYPANTQNYQRIAASSSQYPKTQLFTQNNQGYRPQRSPYANAYYYSQRLN